MNTRINGYARFQTWDGNTIFGEYPLHIKSGNLTVTLMFQDLDAIRTLKDLLTLTIDEIKMEEERKAKSRLGLYILFLADLF